LFGNVVVGVDGHQGGSDALALAKNLAAPSNEITLALPTYALTGGIALPAEVIDEMVSAAQARVAGLDGVEPHAAYGNPIEELALWSASLDLLVVGSRDYGPIGRLVHGSTSGQLARAARCPLLVLTRATRAAEPLEPSEPPTAAAPS